MSHYQILAQRYYKFFKYSRTVGIISLILFLGVTAYNTGNETLNIVSYIFMTLTFACLVECCILYVLYILLKNRK